MKISDTLVIVTAIMLGMFAVPAAGAETGQEYALFENVLAQLEELAPGDAIDVRMGTEKSEYAVGEPFELRFMVSEACYFVLMNVAATEGNEETPPLYGPITFLIPNYKVLDTKLEPGKVYSSLYDFDMKITVAPPIGYETVNLFCSPEPLTLFETDFARDRIYTIEPHETEKLQALSDHLERLRRQEWSGSSVSFLIRETDEGLQPGVTSRDALPKKFRALRPMGGTGTTGKADDFFPPLDGAGQ